MYLLLVHFYCCVVSHWMNISLFVYGIICWWTFELFLIQTKYFWGHLYSTLVGKYLEVVLLGQRIWLCLILWTEKPQQPQIKKKQWFSKAVVPLYTSTNKVWVFQLFHIQHLCSVIFKIILIQCISSKKVQPFKGTVWWVFTNVYTHVTTAIAKVQKIFISPKSCCVPLCSQSPLSQL